MSFYDGKWLKIMKNGISVVIPAYQEEENLRFLLPEIHNVLKKTQLPYEILVIDTCLPMDHTEELCAAQNALCIRCKGNDSYGNATRSGIKHAQYDKTVVMDGDGSHHPGIILQMQESMEKDDLDLVVGSRYVPGGDSANGPVLKFLSVTLNLIFRWLFHLSVKDVSGSFRMYRTEQLQKLDLQCDYFDIIEEILIKLSLQDHFRCREIPLRFSKRKAGDSKRHLFVFISGYLATIIRLKRICRKK